MFNKLVAQEVGYDAMIDFSFENPPEPFVKSGLLDHIRALNAEIGVPGMHIVMNVYYRAAFFLRGDSDGNGTFNGLADGIHILDHQFQGGPAPPCMEAADADGNGVFNGLTDGLYVLAHGFQGGPPPPAPYPECGPDPDPATSLGCESSSCP